MIGRTDRAIPQNYSIQTAIKRIESSNGNSTMSKPTLPPTPVDSAVQTEQRPILTLFATQITRRYDAARLVIRWKLNVDRIIESKVGNLIRFTEIWHDHERLVYITIRSTMCNFASIAR